MFSCSTFYLLTTLGSSSSSSSCLLDLNLGTFKNIFGITFKVEQWTFLFNAFLDLIYFIYDDLSMSTWKILLGVKDTVYNFRGPFSGFLTVPLLIFGSKALAEMDLFKFSVLLRSFTFLLSILWISSFLHFFMLELIRNLFMSTFLFIFKIWFSFGALLEFSMSGVESSSSSSCLFVAPGSLIFLFFKIS